MSDERSLGRRARVYAALGDPGRLAIVDMLAGGDASPGELGRSLDMPTNLVAHHLKVLEKAGVVGRTRSEGDRRRTYLHLLPPHADLARPVRLRAPRVVFVCSRNSARSQLAAVLWTRSHAVPAASAGTRPAERVHPRAVRVALRHGLDLGDPRPAQVAEVVRDDDLLVAVCDNAHEQLGTASPQRRLHWSVPDPAPIDTDDAFEAAYTDLAGRVDRLASILTQGARP